MSTVTAVPLQPVRRSVLVYLWLGIALAVIAAVALAWQAPQDEVAVALAKVRRGDATVQTTASGLLYKVIKPGAGDAHPTDADVTLVNYEGKLINGTTFDASQQPTPMPVKGIVPGVAEALKLMTKGAKYRFWVKPSLAYGDKAAGPIPAHSVLVFDFELLDWKSEAEIRQIQAMQQMMQQQGGAPAGGPPGAAPQGDR
ncbi:FKBP-type peptidyl-prolyl cis-trans isomerase [Sphingomonas sp. RT2P30]|uniref:FKBP-type peptidyl-prolyl cis-trans isomerase n=1 Tax=Parasphingomonas halimpatiens TaxID=3096162 RepID=UPI002FCC63F4